MLTPPPVLLLLFANDPLSPLDALVKERKAIGSIFKRHERNYQIQLRNEANTTNDDIEDLLSRFRNRLVAFHYGGHATTHTLKIEKGSAYVKGLAGFLGDLPNLKFVFLNGCYTAGQVQELLNSGVKAVIATNFLIEDKAAHNFAQTFYEQISLSRSIGEAFKLACSAVKMRHQEYKDVEIPIPIYRSLYKGEGEVNQMPWNLFLDDDTPWVKDWKFEPIQTSIPQLLTRIPPFDPEKDLVDRESEMENLYNLLGNSRKGVALCGMAGIGKTDLAKAYVQKYEEQYDHIAWIEQSNNLEEAILGNKDLLWNLNLVDKDGSKKEVTLAEVFMVLRNLPGLSLLVLDYADESLDCYHELLPNSKNWHVLAISRQILPNFDTITITPLSELFAKALFYKHYHRKNDDEQVALLLHLVDYHSLCIKIIAKAAHIRRIPIFKLCQKILKEGLTLPDVQLGRSIPDHKSRTKKLIPFLYNMFDLKELSDAEFEILYQMALLPATPIEYSVLEEILLKKQADKTLDYSFSETIDFLANKHLIQYDQQEETYKIGNILQDIVISENGIKNEYLEHLINAIVEKTEIDQSKESYLDKLHWLPFGERLRQITEKYSQEEFPLLPAHLGVIYSQIGQHAKSEKLLRFALDQYILKHGKENQTTSTLMSDLGLTLKNSRKLEEAKQFFDDALAIDLSIFGEVHEAITIRRSNLAQVLYALGEYPRAEEEMRLALEVSKKVFPPGATAINRKLSNLAVILMEQDKFEAAIPMLEEALAADRSHLEPNHPSIAIKLGNLSFAHQNLGNLALARKLRNDALNINIKNLGPDHPKVAEQMIKVSKIDVELEDFTTAQKQLVKAWSIIQKENGEHHPSVLELLSEIAAIYKLKNKPELARQLLVEVVEITRKKLKPDHPLLAQLMQQLKGLD